MCRQQVINRISKKRLVAILRGLDAEQAVNTAHALLRAGVELVELTFDNKSPDTFRETQIAIEKIAHLYEGKGYVGAGTVMCPHQVELAHQAGAKFILSPNFNKAVIERTLELGLVSIPAAMTPTEIVHANELGADYVKLFPALPLGIDYLKAILAPLSDIPILAVGGIDLSNISSFLKAGAVGVGIGGKLVDKQLIFARQYDDIAHRAIEIVNMIEEVQ